MPTLKPPLELPGAMHALRLATDPNTRPEELARIALTFWRRDLFAHDRSAVRHYRAAQAVARHPNAPLSALIMLATTFPREVRDNPALQLELATNGSPVDEYNIQHLFRLVPTHDLTPAFRRFFENLWYQLGKPIFGARTLAHHPDPPDQERTQAIRDFEAAGLKYHPPATTSPNQGLEGVPLNAAICLVLKEMRNHADLAVAQAAHRTLERTTPA